MTKGKRKRHNMPILVYSLLSFIIACLSLGEGGTIMVLELINPETFKEACETIDLGDLENIRNTKPLGSLIVRIAEKAKDFDRQTQVTVNRLMCTDICPCFHDNAWKRPDTIKYLSEKYLNGFGRTAKDEVDADLDKYIPFVFSGDRSKSVESYVECLASLNL